jgi:hypothetical protein
VTYSRPFTDATIKRTRSLTHTIERFGLSLLGIACGLFVAAHLSQSRDEILASVWVLAFVTAGGAAGFYFGIDIPPHSVQPGTFDAAELTGALGTVLAASAAVTSVVMIVLDERKSVIFLTATGACWLIGVAMQLVSGLIARAKPV